ncbi:unnamed protein product [Cladocopium goreaui]|uniref:EF-hand domain-containing protein n=1 Tax=Cladocopium goreaui TaxID=2562237 RepID=A0A9P1BWG7_9DINO|nr:unnamed protein product [Cladocopium goreaui]|mmetsp:Transcript_40965/g.88761  ORF Transcript_40965/g.88761 Transcript_40965/m.88761 type:complete len:590 (+) Transcript_40965:47-1816(+)
MAEDAKRSSTRSEFSSKRSKGTSDFSGSDDSSEGSIRLFGNEEQEIFRKPLASVAQVIDPELKTKGRFFQTLSAVLALANLVELGLEADYKCNIGRCESEPIWELLTQIFTILPLAENGIRLAEAKPRRFFCGEKTKVKYKLDIVNCIDTVLVVLRILDVWLLSLVGIESGLRLVSGFRIIRMGPAVRHWQATKELRELWIVIGAVAETVKTLFWVGVMLIFVIWIFGILVSMSLLDRSGDEFDFTYSQWSFQEYWGSVPRSAFSLFQVATRDNWISSMVSPLVKTEPLLLVIFGSYFCIGALALMNSIIAVVVECTLSAARSSSDREEEEKLRADAAVMDSLRKIFHDGDTDGSGELDMDELHALICKHQVRDRLKMLRIPFADLDLLFTLLDTDCTGNVNTDMFFRGCAKLRGPAMACDLHQLSIDLKQNLERCDHNSERIRQVNETLAIVLDHVDDMDISIMKSDVDFKDPVLAARQVRPKTSKSDVIRGRWLMPMAPNEQSMWMDLDRQAKERELASKLNLMLDAPVEASNSKVRDRLDITDSQPPPPPMPDGAKRLDDVRLSEDAKANQVATAMKKIHRIHRFD